MSALVVAYESQRRASREQPTCKSLHVGGLDERRGVASQRLTPKLTRTCALGLPKAAREMERAFKATQLSHLSDPQVCSAK